MMAVQVISGGGSVRVATPSWFVETTSTADTVRVGGGGQSATATSESYMAKATSGIIVGGTPYAGSYDVTPRVDPQVLPTRAKTLSQDMTVEGIPRFDVSNEYGTTVSIG